MRLLTLAFMAIATQACAIEVREIGHLYVGGREVTLEGQPKRARIRGPDQPRQEVDVNGTYTRGATYVGFVRLAHPKHRTPVLMVPGGGLSAASFETTPDGRPGWQWSFLKAGFSTYLADLDQTGRSSFARYPEIDPDEPSFRAHDFLWEVFRIGPVGSYATPGGPRAYADTRFPVRAFANFAEQAQPRFRITEEDETREFDALVKAVCPCILLTHSAAGNGGLAAAKRWPTLVKAVISVEPATVPDAAADALPPHLFVWGDHLDADADWTGEVGAALAYQAKLKARHVRADWLSLPARGIRGNSHLLMMDDNSHAVAEMIQRWIAARGL